MKAAGSFQELATINPTVRRDVSENSMWQSSELAPSKFSLLYLLTSAELKEII
jgi:hypothetical protein